MVEVRRIEGLPSKAEAEKRIAIWEVMPNYVDGSGKAIPMGNNTWAAEARFNAADPKKKK